MHEESSKRRKVDEDVQDGVVAAYHHNRGATTREKQHNKTKEEGKSCQVEFTSTQLRTVAGEDEICRVVRIGKR
uniref:Uncharacterized protein n=1 Tax=Tanacetum cinerariifolium TaxID=118510 RepID=A0A699HSW9_TANCI|nr:hypothetical protein [Tanacetum cinerariifolium]